MSHIYFLDHNPGQVPRRIRVGHSYYIQARLEAHVREGRALLAVMPASRDYENRLHAHFRSIRCGPDKSTYSGDGVEQYVEWLLTHGYAVARLDDVEHLPTVLWEAIDPGRAMPPSSRDCQDQLVLFREEPRERERRLAPLAYHSSLSDEWFTPPEIIEAARRTLGAIDLDPASCPAANAVVKAPHYWSQIQSGLDPAHPWRGRVWMNPPFGGLAPRFMERLFREMNAGNVTAAIALLNANSTTSAWFTPVAERLDAMLVSRGRWRFVAGSVGQAYSSPSAGSVLCYFGPDMAAFAREFAPYGNTFLPMRPGGRRALTADDSAAMLSEEEGSWERRVLDTFSMLRDATSTG